MVRDRYFLAALLTLYLAACSSTGKSVIGYPSVGSHALASRPLLPAQSKAPARGSLDQGNITEATATRSLAHSDGKEREACAPLGGTWVIPPAGKGKHFLVSGSIAYGANDCPSKHEERAFISSNAGEFSQCPGLQGFRAGPFFLLLDPPRDAPYMFGGTGLVGSLTSPSFEPSLPYYVLFLFPGDVVATEYAGAPVGNTIAFPSPFQNGFVWQYLGDATYVYTCSPS